MSNSLVKSKVRRTGKESRIGIVQFIQNFSYFPGATKAEIQEKSSNEHSLAVRKAFKGKTTTVT